MLNRRYGHRWFAAVFATFIFLPGCSHSPAAPNLPGDSDPKSIHQIAPGPAGQEFLKSVSTYKWGDQSNRVTAWFQWIPAAATGPNPDDRALAAETAHTIATYLAANSDSLEQLGSANPALTQSYTLAIVPYLGSLVSEDQLTPQFPPLDALGSAMPKTRSLLAVLANDPTSSLILGQAIDRQVARYQDNLSEVIRRQPGASRAMSEPVAAIARLIALAATAGVRSPDPNSNWSQGIEETELNYLFARATATGPNADISPKYFTNNSELMSPSHVRLQFGEAAWAEYSAMISAFTSRIPDQRAAIDDFGRVSRTIRAGAPPR
ncbi:hypothetical protein ACJEIK_10285 [Mycobacterium sp. SMC-16]|uniref:hypothetical protein n=1 Tax=Mycobacterium sp. SMC-16 TaxID=3385967 RepID=UPI00390CCAEA